MADIPFAGTITIDDTLKSLVVRIIRRDTRAAFDLSSYDTAKLVAVGRNNPALTIDFAMAFTTPKSTGIVTATNFLTGIALAGVQETFEAEIELKSGTDKTYTDAFSFAVRKRRV